ncbi:hypothetical protein [Asticcacaulis sp.]|uniref:hypothetical protein n=1 Tax=Asticcacaulis sp. TaxID=1872648 RepID=UPI0026082244|nr:hypothetical protein [Asticcacaulis sp.]
MFKPIALILFASALALPAAAQDSLENTSKAAANSVEATAQLSGAGVMVVAGSAALPFVAVGASAESTGAALRDSGEAVWDEANKPLTVSPETVVAQDAPDVPREAEKPQKKAQ